MDEYVHLRYLTATHQCELVVHFDTVFQGVTIKEEMHSVRQITDTIGSMIEHTKNKLKKIINDELKSDEGNDSAKENYEIPISFLKITKHRVKHVSNNTKLADFFDENQDKIIVDILGKQFKLLFNPPSVKSMHIPSILYATYCIQPCKFYGLYVEKKQSEFTWYKSKDQITWEKVGDTFDYHISSEDVGSYLKLKCIPVSAKLIQGPAVEVISQNMVQEFPGLPKCPFESRHYHTKNTLQGNDFRFITYNTLSNRYTEFNDIYSYCPLEFLAIDYRKQLIMKEVLGYNADIICLQEVDNREFNSYYKAAFQEKDYIAKFHRKGNNLSEGLLCAVRKSRYKLLSYQLLVLSNALTTRKMFEELHKAVKTNADLKVMFMKQPTSLQIIVLKCKETKKIIVIGNTHLYYHPDATTVRLVQAYMVIKHLIYVKERMMAEWNNYEVILILCGDFNSSPDGAVYKFFSKGRLCPTDDDFCYEVSRKRKMHITHKLNLISACGTPKYTNYTNDFKSCLDYIFIENNDIEVKNIIPLPEEELEQYVGLPNEVYPSDHLALVVDLQFKKTICK